MMKRIGLMVVVMALAAGRADAGLILGNLPGTGFGNGSTGGALTLAVEFKVGAVAQTLGSATFVIGVNSGTTVTASLHAFNAASPTAPGALLETLTSPVVTATVQPYTFNGPAPFTLLANTNYWIELDATPGFFAFNFGGTPTGPGATYVTDYYSDPFFTTNGGIPAVQLDTTVSVPEPASLGLVAVGGLVVLAARRRKRS